MHTQVTVSEITLETLYNINKHARRYAELATKNYKEGKKTTAKANSNKKKALYAVKRDLLERLQPAADRVELHVIDDRNFYCLYFDDWSFHSPTNEFTLTQNCVTTEKELNEFTKTTDKQRSDKSLKQCLLYIEDQFGLNPNEYLPTKYLRYGSKRHFIGWPYLGSK